MSLFPCRTRHFDGSRRNAIHAELGVPVKYIGVGETIDDLQKFDADDFVNALFERPKDDETPEEVSENK